MTWNTVENVPVALEEAEKNNVESMLEAVSKPKERKAKPKVDMVNHPPHYTAGGIETIDYIEAKEFNYHLGNAVKYIWRADEKWDAIEDLKKAKWYIERELKKRGAE